MSIKIVFPETLTEFGHVITAEREGLHAAITSHPIVALIITAIVAALAGRIA